MLMFWLQATHTNMSLLSKTESFLSTLALPLVLTALLHSNLFFPISLSSFFASFIYLLLLHTLHKFLLFVSFFLPQSSDVVPTFVLMDIQGPNATMYLIFVLFLFVLFTFEEFFDRDSVMFSNSQERK